MHFSVGIIFMLLLYTAACFFLIFVILIQAGDKGGGLSSLGSSSQGLSDALGVTGAEKTMNKLTTISACLFIILAIALSYVISGQVQKGKNILPDAAASASPLSTQVAPQATPLTESGTPSAESGTAVPAATTAPAQTTPAQATPATPATN